VTGLQNFLVALTGEGKMAMKAGVMVAPAKLVFVEVNGYEGTASFQDRSCQKGACLCFLKLLKVH